MGAAVVCVHNGASALFLQHTTTKKHKPRCDECRQHRQPWRAVGVVERRAGAHFFEACRRVVIIGVVKLARQSLRQQRAHRAGWGYRLGGRRGERCVQRGQRLSAAFGWPTDRRRWRQQGRAALLSLSLSLSTFCHSLTRHQLLSRAEVPPFLWPHSAHAAVWLLAEGRARERWARLCDRECVCVQHSQTRAFLHATTTKD